MSAKEDWPKEKRWKDVYTRSAKLARAEQLGIDYPQVTDKQLLSRAHEPLTEHRRNILFICSRNQWRSPTAEAIWRKHPQLSVKSAGTSPNARRKVTVGDIRWAEIIFVMEEKHQARLKAEFTRLLENKPIHVLDIPDEYKYMDPELVELLEQSVEGLLGLKKVGSNLR